MTHWVVSGTHCDMHWKFAFLLASPGGGPGGWLESQLAKLDLPEIWTSDNSEQHDTVCRYNWFLFLKN